MYIEYVIGSYDNGFGYDARDQTSKYITSYDQNSKGIPIKSKDDIALLVFQEIVNMLTAKSFTDNDIDNLDLSDVTFNAEESLFSQLDPDNPTFDSFLEFADEQYKDLKSSYIDASNPGGLGAGVYWTVFKFNGSYDTTNINNTAYLYFNMWYQKKTALHTHYIQPIFTFKLLSDLSELPLDSKAHINISRERSDYVRIVDFPRYNADFNSTSSPKTTPFHAYKLIISMSPTHLYFSGITYTRKFVLPVATPGEYPEYDTEQIYADAVLLSKYQPYDHWFYTPIKENRDKFKDVIFWVLARPSGVIRNERMSNIVTLNAFNIKTKDILTKPSDPKKSNPCRFKWSSIMPLNHESGDQGLQHVSSMSNENKKQSLWMGHLAIDNIGGTVCTGDISKFSRLYYVHGTADYYDSIITDVNGIAYKLLPFFWSNDNFKDKLNNSPSAMQPKLAVPMI